MTERSLLRFQRTVIVALCVSAGITIDLGRASPGAVNESVVVTGGGVG